MIETSVNEYDIINKYGKLIKLYRKSLEKKLDLLECSVCHQLLPSNCCQKLTYADKFERFKPLFDKKTTMYAKITA